MFNVVLNMGFASMFLMQLFLYSSLSLMLFLKYSQLSYMRYIRRQIIFQQFHR